MDENIQSLRAGIERLDLSAARRRALLRRLDALEDTLQTGAARQALLAGVLETTVDGILTIDERGLLQSVNAAAERLFGYTLHELKGRNVSMLMPEPYRSRHDGFVRAYLETGQARVIGIGRGVVGLRRNGETFPMELALSEAVVGGQRFFTGIVRDVSERRGAEEAMVAASEAERKLIGQELHDVLGQELTGISLLTGALENRLRQLRRPESRQAAQIRELSQTVLSQVKLLAQGLYPTELERNGLAAALHQLALSVANLHTARCEFTEDPGAARSVEGSTALHLFRIAQEAASNAVKHGRASAITISIDRGDHGLRLAVEDDGVGIPQPLPKSAGMGLTIMQYRANQIGAELAIEPRTGGGTAVGCFLPDPPRRDAPGTAG